MDMGIVGRDTSNTIRGQRKKMIKTKRSYFGKSAQPNPVQILIRLYDGQCSKMFVLKFQPDDLEKFSSVDYSCDSLHDHTSGDPGRFCKLPIPPKWLSTLTVGGPACYTATIGSTVYSLYFTLESSCFYMDKFDFRSMDLNVDPDLPEGVKWKNLPSPQCRFDHGASLLALRGNLYLLGGQPGALRFNPRTNKWSELLGPGDVSLNDLKIRFNASLGEFSGKILFYEYDGLIELLNSKIHIYDVVSEEWDTYPGVYFDDIKLFYNAVLGNAVVREGGKNTIYWLNKNGLVYSYNLNTKCLRRGRIAGMENDFIGSTLRDFSGNISIVHLTGDLFCLFWGERSVLSRDPYTTETHCHFTFIRVIEDYTNCLSVYVVGCFKDIVPGLHSCYEASLLR